MLQYSLSNYRQLSVWLSYKTIYNFLYCIFKMFCDVYYVFSCPLMRLGVGDPARLKHSPEVREIF